MRIFLARHGETEGKSSFRYWGSTDLSLDEKGRQQAEELAERLGQENFTTVYTSTLQRAVKTAEAVCAKLGSKALEDARLNEINFGDIEGLTFEQIQQKYPELEHIWNGKGVDYGFPSGESFKDFNARVSEFLKDMIKKHKEDEDILIVGHGGPFRLMMCHLLEIDIKNWWKFRFPLASVTILDAYKDGASLCLFGDISHLT